MVRCVSNSLTFKLYRKKTPKCFFSFVYLFYSVQGTNWIPFNQIHKFVVLPNIFDSKRNRGMFIMKSDFGYRFSEQISSPGKSRISTYGIRIDVKEFDFCNTIPSNFLFVFHNVFLILDFEFF